MAARNLLTSYNSLSSSADHVQPFLEGSKDRQRQLLKRRLKAFSVISCLILIPMGINLISQVESLHKMTKEKEKLDKELASLQEEQRSLEHEVNLLQDESYLGKIARKYYYLSEKDEIIFVLPENNKKD